MARCRLVADILGAARPQIRTAIAPIALLLGAAVLPGQSADVLGKRNNAFLNGLWQAGYIEYADKIGELVAASNLPEAEKKAVEASHTKLKIAIAANAGDAETRFKLVIKVIDEKTALLGAAAPGSEASINLLSEVVDQYRLLSDAVSEWLAQEKDPAKQVAIRKDAVERFTAAQADLKERKKAYAPLREDEKQGSEVPLLVAFYGLGKVCYYQALIHPAESLAAKHLIEESVSTLEDFDLEFGDTLAGFEAKLMMALCQKRLGDASTALELCDDAIALRERFDHDKKNNIWQVDPNAADVIAAAVLQKTLFLKDQNEHGKIIEVTKDYFATIPNALEAQQGKAVLAAQGEALFMSGDTAAATAVAQRLIENDPKGFWGYRGQKLLSDIIQVGSKVGAGDVLKTAESLAGQGEYEKALQMCRQAVLQAKATADKESAAKAMLINGAIQWTRGWYHEAAVAFDAVARDYPKSEVAPDALWRAINCFMELNETDKLPMFKRFIEERSRQLVRDYPTDSHVGDLQLIDGQQLDRAGKSLEAAAVYEKISPDSVRYLDARFYAASAYLRHARKLENGSQPKDAEPFAAKALSGFLSVLKDTESAKLTATDTKVKARIEQVEFNARLALANLYLSGTAAKPAEAENILKPIKLSDDDKQAPKLWALRIRIKVESGKIEDATAEMQAALDKAPESRDLVAACRSLASTLDSRAVERSKTDRLGANDLWKQATQYYLRSATGASNAEVAQIAERLRVIGLIANEVGEKVEGWFELPDFKAKDMVAWQGALDLYGRLAEKDATTYMTRVGRASILGYLGKWDECVAELSKLFEENNILGANQRLDPEALKKKPELLNPFLEWGIALRMPTATGEEKVRRARASELLHRFFNSVPPDSKQWWFARYAQIQTLFDRGLYDDADVSLSSLERTNQDFDGDRFQLKLRFMKLKTDIAMKVPKKK